MRERAGKAIEIFKLGDDDVRSLIACIRRCYGESYSEPEFYEPNFIRDELRANRLLCIGARAGSRLVGHVGTRIPSPGDGVADTIAGIVDPEYRGMGLTARMGSRMVASYRELGILAARHIATGVHDRTQRLIVASGGVATGVLLGHISADTNYRGIEHAFGPARIGAVVYFQAYDRLGALDAHLPERYVEPLVDLYEQLQLERRVIPTSRSSSATRADRSTLMWPGSVAHDPRRGISSFRFGSLAGDARRPARELVEGELERCQAVAYADVPIADPRSPRLLDLLHTNGFCFGALLPGTATSEAIRMQRLSTTSIAPEAIVTASPQGSAMLQWVLREYDRTTS